MSPTAARGVPCVAIAKPVSRSTATRPATPATLQRQLLAIGSATTGGSGSSLCSTAACAAHNRASSSVDATSVQKNSGAQNKATSEWSCDAYDAWMKPLSNGDVAVVLWNREVCGTHTQLSVSWKELGLPASQPMAARDLFEKKDLGKFRGSFSAFVNIDGVVMVRLSKVPPP